jgi:hypothetical protein
MINQTALLIGLLVFAALIAVISVVFLRRGPRRRELADRFGPEYERAVEEYGDPAVAERELARRAKRVERFRLKELSDDDRARFDATWGAIQTRFVDDPSGAVQEADALINTVMLVRGYPLDDFEQRVLDLSVHHANVVQHYRAARALAIANQAGSADTEELRQAFVHYRVLFAELVGAPTASAAGLREVHA